MSQHCRLLYATRKHYWPKKDLGLPLALSALQDTWSGLHKISSFQVVIKNCQCGKSELMLWWKLLICSDYFHLSLPALYKKPSTVILFLFFCHSTETQIHRLKANANMFSSDKGSKSDCKKTHCKLLFKTWLKSVNESFGLIIFLTPRMPVCACTSKNANSFEFIFTKNGCPISLHVPSSKSWRPPNLQQALFFTSFPTLKNECFLISTL